MATLKSRDPLLAEIDAMSEQFQKVFGVRPAANAGAGFLPPVDVWETEQDVVIELDMPGVRPDDLSAEVVDGQLVVTGERSLDPDAVRRYRSERWQGRFVRTFAVPQGVDGERIKASYDAGVLRITLPKPEEARPKRIAIAQGAAQKELASSAS